LKRVKRRYLALLIESESEFTERDVIDAVWAAVTKLYGEVGASLTGLVLVNYYGEEKIAVVRVMLSAQDMMKASLSTISAIGGKEASVHVLAVSGTLKALFRKTT